MRYFSFDKLNEIHAKWNAMITQIEKSWQRDSLTIWIDFNISSDAEDAVKARDGYDYDGYRLRVEFPRGGGPGHRSNRSDRSRSSRGAVTKRSQYRVLVSGLPPR